MKEIELVYHTDGSRTLNARVEAHEGAASGSRRPITWHERLSSSRFQKGIESGTLAGGETGWVTMDG